MATSIEELTEMLPGWDPWGEYDADGHYLPDDGDTIYDDDGLAIIPATVADDDTMPLDYESEFREVVLGWVQYAKDASAAEVTKVSGRGSDWDGDTEGGFFSSFYASIHYRTDDDVKRSIDCAGEEMGSLWDWVIKGNRLGAACP